MTGVTPGNTIESDYYTFMGFDPALARGGLSHYVPYVAGLDPVLELAPGRGEFLDVLRDAGTTGCGVDLDEGMVAAAVARGHDVKHGDAIAFLHDADPGTYGGVFAAHFVEHLDPDAVLALVAGAKRALRPGGRLILATPNAASLSVMGYDFWKDPTHVRFYDPMLLRFFLAQAGFEVEESGTNPRNDPGPPPHLHAGDTVEAHPPLTEAIAEAVRRAARSSRAKDASSDVGHLLGHLLGVVAERLRVTEEALIDLRAAHERLLAQLYPGNEIYVVGRA
jgi:SAM-dependent methyltransferase